MSTSEPGSDRARQIDAILALADRFEEAALRGGPPEVEREGEEALASLKARTEELKTQLAKLAEESAAKDKSIAELQAGGASRNAGADGAALEKAKGDREHQRSIELKLLAQKHEEQLELSRLENALELARIKVAGEHAVAHMKAEADKAIARETARDEAQGRTQTEVATIQREAQERVAAIQKKIALIALIGSLGGAALGAIGGYFTARVKNDKAEANQEISRAADGGVPNRLTAAQQEDYVRSFFLPKEEPISGKMGRREAERVFVARTGYFLNAQDGQWTLGKVADVLSSERKDSKSSEDLVVMRCKPPSGVLKARRATWNAIFDELTIKKVNCADVAALSEPDKLRCAASSIRNDVSQSDVTAVLATLYEQGQKLRSADTKNLLDTAFSIKSGFSGSGFAVSGTGEPASGYKQAVVDAMEVPEYWVANKSLAEAHCRCIRFSPFPERHGRQFDPDWIWENGDSSCKQANEP